jgi:hypothetical protein
MINTAIITPTRPRAQHVPFISAWGPVSRTRESMHHTPPSLRRSQVLSAHHHSAGTPRRISQVKSLRRPAAMPPKLAVSTAHLELHIQCHHPFLLHIDVVDLPYGTQVLLKTDNGLDTRAIADDILVDEGSECDLSTMGFPGDLTKVSRARWSLAHVTMLRVLVHQISLHNRQ